MNDKKKTASIKYGGLTFSISGDAASELSLPEALAEIKGLLQAWGFYLNGDLIVEVDDVE